MSYLASKILMITPYARVQRGNSLTSARLQLFLSSRGFNIERYSLDTPDWAAVLTAALRSHDYSLVHGFHALYFGRVLKQFPVLRQKHIILTTTGTDINFDLKGSDREMVIDTMRLSDKIVIFNEDFRADLGTIDPDWLNKTVTIPQGVYLEESPVQCREDFGLSSDQVVFLLPSGLRPVKNIQMAIKALTGLAPRFPQIHLLVMGAALDDDYSLLLLEEMKDKPWITYLGEVPHAEIGGIMALGDVVLNTSLAEGQPQAALEAMSLGKPCILSTVPGNLNIIESGIEGFYVQDEIELAAAAQRLITDPQLRREMGERARRLVDQRFNLEQELAAYIRLYQAYLPL